MYHSLDKPAAQRPEVILLLCTAVMVPYAQHNPLQKQMSNPIVYLAVKTKTTTKA